jgi:hypothetical protein
VGVTGSCAPRRTALAVWVPEAEPLVGSFRACFDAASVARRIVPHVTVLFPFVPADDLARARPLAALHARSLTGFDAALERVRRFDRHVWLEPTPHACWVGLIEETSRRFPETPPYGGVFDTVVPHLTVGEATLAATTDEIHEAAERELASRLPLRFRVDALSLLEEAADGTWSVAGRLPLG